MSPVSSLGLLALAALAAAHGHQHARGHQHLHARQYVPSYNVSSSAISSSTSTDTCTDEITSTSSSWSSTSTVPTTTTSGTPSSPTFPACWSACFGKYNATESDLCSSIGAEVKSCIDSGCASTPGAAEQYDSWVSSYCSSSTSTVSVAAYPTGGYSTSICTETSTLIYQETTLYSTYQVTHTITVNAVPSAPATVTAPAGPATYPAGPASSPVSPASPASECGYVTVTSSIYSTIYVTGGAGEWYSGGGWGSETSTETSYVTPYSPASTSPVESATSAPAPAPYSPSAPSSESSSAPSPYSSAPSAYTPSSTVSSSGSSVTGNAGFAKRGLAYNDASLTSPFISTGKFGWAYNWGSLPQGLDTSSLTYIPMLWSNGANFVSWWTTNAETVLSEGAEWFFSFNEPDMPSQANMSPQEAADAWMQYMEPYAGRVKLVAPAVTNGVGSGLGLDWLQQFLSACSSCTIDAVNQHWYDSAGNDLAYFQQQISEISSATGKPVFVSEWAGIGSDDELSSFMEQAAGWMDQQSFILGYSYYMVGDGFLNDGTGLSPLGQIYTSM